MKSIPALLILVNLSALGQQSDSIWENEIYFGHVESISFYYNRDSVINGKCTDYYANGNIHISGTFDEGLVRDTLKEFYENGNLKYLKVVKDFQRDTVCMIKTVLLQYYYEDGKPQRIYNLLLKDEIEFYATGLKKSEIYHQGEIVANTFYPDGSIKSKIKGSTMKEYDKNGNIVLSISYKKKPTRTERQLKIPDCTRSYSYCFYGDGNSVIKKGNIAINSWNYHYLFGEFPDSVKLQSLIEHKK